MSQSLLEQVDRLHEQEAECMEYERAAYLRRDFDEARRWHDLRIRLLVQAESLLNRCDTAA